MATKYDAPIVMVAAAGRGSNRNRIISVKKTTGIDYNAAQFRLHRAVGWAIQ